MGKKNKAAAPTPVKTGDGRNNGKATKKRPKQFDPQKRRLVTV